MDENIICLHIFCKNIRFSKSSLTNKGQHENGLDYQTTRMKQIYKPTHHMQYYFQAVFTKFLFLPVKTLMKEDETF
jgi:hypothetical protein